MKTIATLALIVYTMSQAWVYPTQGGVSFGLGDLGYHYQYSTAIKESF